MQPQSVATAEGLSAQFSVQVNGSAPLTYRWQRNDTDILGSPNAAVYNTGVLAISDSGAVFRVIVTNSLGQTTSSPAALTVGPALAVIQGGPVPLSLVAGQTANYTVTATSTSPMSFQWRRNGQPIAGATGSTFSFVTALSDDGSRISVTVTNGAGPVTSAEALLRVSFTAVAPGIVSQPSDASARVGGSATFFVTASGTGPLVYQWLRAGVPIPGARIESPNALPVSYTLQPVRLSDDNSLFSVQVINSAGQVVSNEAKLNVTP